MATGVGRISLLVDSPLRTVNLAFGGLDSEVRKQITRYVKSDATPIWQQETAEHAASRLQVRVLAGTARVGVSGLSVTLKAGGGGTLSTGTKTAAISRAVAFGADRNSLRPVHSRKGRLYKRRIGLKFNLPRRGGYVVYPAAREAIPRLGSLIVQTVIRTTHEVIEKVSK